MTREPYAVLLERFREDYRRLADEIGSTVVGQRDACDLLLAALLARGQVLLSGAPGSGKARMVAALARVAGLSLRSVWLPARVGPAEGVGAAHILLARGMDQACPATRAGFFQTMEDAQGWSESHGEDAVGPFFFVASQDGPATGEQSELSRTEQDRFMVNIPVAYPSAPEEQMVLAHAAGGKGPGSKQLFDAHQIRNMQRLIATVPVSPYVLEYSCRLVRASRPDDPTAPDFVRESLVGGAGVHAGVCLVRVAQAWAAMSGRSAVSLDDIQQVARPVLAHRLVREPTLAEGGLGLAEIVTRLIDSVPEPEVPKYAASSEELLANLEVEQE